MAQTRMFTGPVVVIAASEASDAWLWLLDKVSDRPDLHCGLCIYDEKTWEDGLERVPLLPAWAGQLACLYLTSQLGDLVAILHMASGGAARDVVTPDGTLDADVRRVIESQPRFRYSLSEHLAFWVRLATRALCAEDDSRFAHSKPNVQPEDKDPDGLFLSAGPPARVEIQSVKSSIGDPQPEISSASFRSRGTLSRREGKLLEDFWRFARKNRGFTRLDKLLGGLCEVLRLPLDQEARMAVLASTECSYNAVVVADERYGTSDLFQGYHYVTPHVTRRIATFIGADNWRTVAEEVRQRVLRTLNNALVL